MALRLFVPGPLAAAGTLCLDAGAARHVQVRRLQPGDALVLFDGRGGEWLAEVAAMRRDGVDVRLHTHVAVERELPIEVTLAVGMPANERMDWLVEKATELGAARIQPLHCERSVLRLSGDRAARKQLHWQAIAVAATEQCGRTRVPQVEPMRGLDETLATRAGATCWLLSPGAATAPQRPAPAAPLVLLSGPEGGFSSAEESAAIAAGCEPVRLGPRVLRAETAPLAVLAWLGLSG